MEIWETGRVEKLADVVASDAVYDDYPNGTQYRGLEEISAYVRHVHSWASNIQMSVLSVHEGASSATAEWEMTAVHDRPIGDRVPVATGRSIKLRGVTIVETRDGKIVRAADYIDVASFVLQLGAAIHLPGGVVLELPLDDKPFE